MPKRHNLRRIILIIVALLAGLLVLGGVGFYAWATGGPGPLPVAVDALQPNAQVQISTDPWLVFRPASAAPLAGLVFYPGGRVDATAYAPQAQAIAAEGYLVVIPPMPLDLAVFDPNVAGEVIAAFPEVQCWAVGGHSLGGSMAARYANQNRDQVEGLIFWASYPAQSDDLSAADIVVVSIYGTQDGLADPETVLASASLLPPDTTWVAIEGGNHAQFGWYGEQAGDNPATITPEDQMEQTVAATLDGLAQVAGCGQTTAQQ